MGSGGDGQDGGSEEGGSPNGNGLTSKKLIDLKDCLTDSPRFRIQLAEHEAEISDLESKLDRVVGSCDRMVNNGQAYVEACRSFSSSVRELAGHFHENEIVEQSLRRFYDTLAEVQSFHSILFDQAQRSVQSALRSFLTGELKKVKDMKKTFHKVSEELNAAVHRNAHAPKSKPLEADELSAQLANMQTQFSHTAIDYGYQINAIRCVQGHHLLDHLLSYMRAQLTFFHQGYDLLREFDPFMRHVASKVDDLRKTSEEDIARMNSRHNLVIPQHLNDGSPEEPLCPMDNPAASIELEGYLFKRSSGAFKSWSRRWFVMRNHQLCYQSESKAEDLFVVAEDLRICTVKMAEDLERRFCFEVVTPARSCLLQADSEAVRKRWLAYLEAGIARALRITASNKKNNDVQEFRVRTATLIRGRSPTPELSESPILGKRPGSIASLTSNYSLGLDFLDVPGNDVCADCCSKNPKWASINLGIMLCIECCGIHRNLGVHITKVRSITLDDWEPEVQKIMCALGNARVNAILEYEIPENVKKPTPASSRADRELFIRAKYIQHAFVHPHPNFERPEFPLQVTPQPPPRLQQLLSSQIKSTPDISPRGSPRTSPHFTKRTLSPSIRLRATKPKSYRPLSQSLSSGMGIGDNDSVDSDDDLLREFAASTDSTTSSMALLAENYKKLEKSGKLKSWNLGKVKAPKKSPFTLGKFSKSYQALNRKFRTEFSRHKYQVDRDAHSDTEDSEPSSAMPLLQSRSALALSPPRKPPRTFKQRKLDLTGDGDDVQGPSLFEETDDFSSDVLSAIREMGVIYSTSEGAEEERREEDDGDSREERFTRSLPNGGLRLTLTGEPTSPGSLSPKVSPSPKNQSPLTSEPPGRPFPPPPLSPVDEGQGQVTEGEENQPSPGLQMSPISVDSSGVFISEDTTAKRTLESPEAAGNEEQVGVGVKTVVDSTAVSSPTETSSPSTSDVTYFTTSPIHSDAQSDLFSNISDSSTPVVPRRQHNRTTSNELQIPRETSASEIKLHFDTKRMSMISLASTDWFSADEDEEEVESNISDSPELQDAFTYMRPGSNPLEEEIGLFSTPPSSPPLIVLNQGSGKRDQSSTRPQSASPVGLDQRREEGKRRRGRSLEKEIMRPHSASPPGFVPKSGVSGIREPETGERRTRPKSASPLETAQQPLPNGKRALEKCAEEVERQDRESSQPLSPNSQPLSPNSLEDSMRTIGPEDEDQPDENKTMIESSVSKESTPDLSQSTADTDTTPHPSPQKSYSADASPNTASKETLSGSPLTRSATDIVLRSKSRSEAAVRTRKRCQTVTAVDVAGSNEKRALVGATSDDYFAKTTEPQNLVASFSEQDIQDILKTSKKERVPILTVETVEDEDEGGKEEGEAQDGGRGGGEGGGGGKEGGGEGGEGDRNHLQTPGSLGSREVSPEIVEPVIIPDSITPDMYLYQSVATQDLPGILCAKFHGGDVNFINNDDEGKCPMLVAVDKCSTVLVEFLYQNGAKLTLTDDKGRGCLHRAAICDDASVVVLLLRRGASVDALDADGKDALQIALDHENGDIVTLLRVAKLKQDDKGHNLEDQVAEVYKDFEVAAQVDPERMKRRSQASSDSGSIASRDLK